MRDYVIIGTGPAGVSAAEVIREREPNSSITLIGDDPHGFYSRPGLAYYLTGEVSDKQLSLRQAARFRHLRTKAVLLFPDKHQVVTRNGRGLVYDRLLLATGSTASKITNPGADLEGVIKLDNLEDAREIVRLARKGRAAVVVGGGITALEFVEALVARGVQTHYLLRSDRYWPNVLDETESRIVEARLKSHGVRLHYQTQIAKISGKNGRVAEVEMENGERIACQIVAVAIGVQPRLDLAKSAGLKVERGILTDEYLQTSVADIFAAGDVVQALDPKSGKTILETLWGNALAQGHIAGRNMCGDHVPFRKHAAFNVTRLAGLTTTIIGAVGKGKDDNLVSIARGDSEMWRLLPDVMAVQRDSQVNRTRIMVGEKTIVGALV